MAMNRKVNDCANSTVSMLLISISFGIRVNVLNLSHERDCNIIPNKKTLISVLPKLEYPIQIKKFAYKNLILIVQFV